MGQISYSCTVSAPLILPTDAYVLTPRGCLTCHTTSQKIDEHHVYIPLCVWGGITRCDSETIKKKEKKGNQDSQEKKAEETHSHWNIPKAQRSCSHSETLTLQRVAMEEGNTPCYPGLTASISCPETVSDTWVFILLLLLFIDIFGIFFFKYCAYLYLVVGEERQQPAYMTKTKNVPKYNESSSIKT